MSERRLGDTLVRVVDARGGCAWQSWLMRVVDARGGCVVRWTRLSTPPEVRDAPASALDV